MTEIHVTENQDREVSPAYEDAVRSGIFSQESLCWSLLFTSLHIDLEQRSSFLHKPWGD